MHSDGRAYKTVYVLGAGFSFDAGGPNQAALLGQIFDLPDAESKIAESKEVLARFLDETLNIQSEFKRSISLEDVFTPIDRCLADGVSLRGNTAAQLEYIRERLEYLIGVAIDTSIKRKSETQKRYVGDFAEHLARIASLRARKKEAVSAKAAKDYDPVSVISLNWDILLDRRLHEALCVQDEHKTGDYEAIGVVDYCCYISSVEETEQRIRPGLWTLGAGGYNVKLLKLHGSMNWLQCSNCQRLFVAFDEKVGVPVLINPRHCRHCARYGIHAKLQGSLVMPTFLKDLSNFQIKLIWQNAGVELMEADRLVFIGYSLPQADFEFRQLLSRMVQRDAKLEVVLYEPGHEEQYKDECKRYSDFFGGRAISFHGKGAADFVRSEVASRGATTKPTPTA